MALRIALEGDPTLDKIRAARRQEQVRLPVYETYTDEYGCLQVTSKEKK